MANGPNIQIPTWAAQAFPDNPEAQVFLHAVQQTAFALSRSGPTASRPTSSMSGRWIGMPFFDTTLGFQITLKSVSPDVWVNSAGAPV